MYRYLNGHEESWGSLEEFLDKERAEKGGRAARALYMEAHIVPRDGSERRSVDFVELSDHEGSGEEEEEDDRNKGSGKGKVRDTRIDVGEQDTDGGRSGDGKLHQGKGKEVVQDKGVARRKKKE